MRGGAAALARRVRPPPGAGARVEAAASAPELHVVYVHPEIPTNTGGFGRTAIGLGSTFHLIKPLGFSIDDTQVRRSGLDYWPHVDLRVHPDFEAFLQGERPQPGELFFFTRAAERSVLEAAGLWRSQRRLYLVFGNETSGLPAALERRVDEGLGTRLAIPMHNPDTMRCYNLQAASTIALWEAFASRRRPGG